jgi:basic membrane protein A
MAVSKGTWIAVGLVIIIIVAGVAVYWWYTRPVEEKAEVFKVAFIVTAALDDKSWNQWGYDALKDIDALEDIEVTYAEYVAIADFERVAGDYAAQGYDLIIGHTFDYSQAALAVADQYPNTYFLVYGAMEFRPNLAGYGVWGHEGLYCMGMLGAMLTETDKIGIVLSFKYPVQLVEYNGFVSGAKAVNPNITVYATWTGTWYDVAKGYEAAISMIDDGVDFISIISSGPGIGAIDACEERGKYVTGAFVDMYEFAPSAVVTSVVYYPYNAFLSIINAIREGTFEGKSYDFGMADGTIKLAPYHDFEDVIPQDVKDAIAETVQKIKLGTLKVPFIPDRELPP